MAGAGMNGLFDVDSKPFPKWYRALTISGKPAGLGFECPVCHLGYTHDAPEQIFHCGAMEQAPRIRALLPTRRIGSGQPVNLPGNVFLVGWE